MERLYAFGKPFTRPDAIEGNGGSQMRYEEFIKNTMEEFEEKGAIHASEFPDLELYIDQAALFMNRSLSVYKDEADDQVITKTMIGNYAKHRMLPRPQNKRYTKDHLIMLTLIFYLKGNFQMDEIELLVKPLIDNYNSTFDDKIDLTQLYDGILSTQERDKENRFQQVADDMEQIKTRLNETIQSDDDVLELFMMITSLCMRADAHRYLAKKLLDEYFVNPNK